MGVAASSSSESDLRTHNSLHTKKNPDKTSNPNQPATNQQSLPGLPKLYGTKQTEESAACPSQRLARLRPQEKMSFYQIYYHCILALVIHTENLSPLRKSLTSPIIQHLQDRA